MIVKKLLHTRMRVSDVEATIACYRDVLGLALLERHVSPRGSQLAFLSVPDSDELTFTPTFAGSPLPSREREAELKST